MSFEFIDSINSVKKGVWPSLFHVSIPDKYQCAVCQNVINHNGTMFNSWSQYEKVFNTWDLYYGGWIHRRG